MARRRLTPELRQSEIIEAAERVLRRDGLLARVEDVVAEAGAAKGTFYTCFASWDDLMAEIRQRETRRTLQQVAPAFALAEAGDWPAVLPALARGFIEAVRAMQGLHAALFHSPFTVARPLPPEQRPTARIADLLRAGNAAGAWQVAHPHPSAALVFAAIHQAADEITAGADPPPVYAALDELLSRAVVATSPTDRTS